jgi:hypothetical protein
MATGEFIQFGLAVVFSMTEDFNCAQIINDKKLTDNQLSREAAV